MREQLQKLIDKYLKREDDGGYSRIVSAQSVADELESILAANPEPVQLVKPGWLCKDRNGLVWCDEKPEFSDWWYTQPDSQVEELLDVLIDPWPDHPNGGPECLMEVR